MSRLFGKTREIDMCTGPVLKKIALFALPIMAANILQILYNAADTIVVGRFSADGNAALAAVGTTSNIIGLVTNLMVGLSVGANVLIARYYGEKNPQKVSFGVHTAMLLSILVGIVTSVAGVILTPTLLHFIDVPDTVFPLSKLYMTVYFGGFLFLSVYNFGSAVLRSVGDSKRPLIFMALSGALNVVLNLIFVIVFHMGVAGVALATVISTIAAAGMVVLSLMKTESLCKMEICKLKIYGPAAKEILRIGIPSALQGTLFAFSNSLVQGAINSFGKNAMAGAAAAENIENVLYMGMASLGSTAMAFTSQNMGARKPKMIRKVMSRCLILNLIMGAFMAAMLLLFGEAFLRFYGVKEAEAISAGLTRVLYEGCPCVLCALIEIFPGSLRGMSRSMEPTIITLLGACALRVVWIKTVFAARPTLATVFLVFPVSWVITGIALFIGYWLQVRRIEKQFTLCTE